jgi:hypothetical protein
MATPSRLLRLPRELRNNIYWQVIANEEKVYLKATSDGLHCLKSTSPFLLASKQLRAECLEVLQQVVCIHEAPSIHTTVVDYDFTHVSHFVDTLSPIERNGLCDHHVDLMLGRYYFAPIEQQEVHASACKLHILLIITTDEGLTEASGNVEQWWEYCKYRGINAIHKIDDGRSKETFLSKNPDAWRWVYQKVGDESILKIGGIWQELCSWIGKRCDSEMEIIQKRMALRSQIVAEHEAEIARLEAEIVARRGAVAGWEAAFALLWSCCW